MAVEISYSFITAYNGNVFQNRHAYMKKTTEYRAIAEEIQKKDTSFYRMEKTENLTLNDSMTCGYYGLGHSSSTYDETQLQFMKEIIYDWYSYWPSYGRGNTKIMDSLLGIKYIITPKGKTYRGYNFALENGNYQVLENPTALSIGYIAENPKTELEETSNPFKMQEELLNGLTGEENKYYEEYMPSNIKNENIVEKENNIYGKQDDTKDGKIIMNYKIKDNDDLYFHITSSYNGVQSAFEIFVNGKPAGQYIGIQNNGVIPLEEYLKEENSDNLEIIIQWRVNEDIPISEITLVKENNQAWEKANEKLKENQLTEINDREGILSGNIEIQENGMLFTTIPYDKNLKVEINGKEIKPEKIYSYFLGIPVEKGKQEIKIEYKYSSFTIGIIISLIVLIGVLIYLWKKRNKKEVLQLGKNKRNI